MTRRGLPLLLVLAMVLVTALGVYLIQAVDEPHQPKPQPVPVPVEVATITPHNFTYRLEALGTVQSNREAAVGVKISGPVILIPPEVELGAAVKEGALLAEIDPTPFRIELSRQEALVARAHAEVRGTEVDMARQKTLIRLNREKLLLARSEHERMITLLHKELIARQEVERAELTVRKTQEELERAESGLREAEVQHAVAQAELAKAQAELARARENLADTQVRAPFAGVISEKRVTLGEQVGPGAVLFRLSDLASVKILIRIRAADIDFLRPGTRAEVTVSGLPEPFRGRVARIGPRADNETRTFPVEVMVENQGPKRLLPGMFARAHIPVHTYPKAILIPRTSVLSNNGTPTVYIADVGNGVAHRRSVTIARTFGSRHLILRGLRAGELLVVTGQRLLRDGAAIRVVGTQQLEP
ncbi:MAG: efflux RND transporter periplasmic adaptor subunit [Candidatus Binatia bacterium]